MVAIAKRTSSNTQNSACGAIQDALRGAARREMGLGPLGDRTRAALVAQPGGRLGDVADQDQAGLRAERVEHGGGEVGLEQHVGLADVAPAGERRAVEHPTVLEQRLVHRPGGDPDVLPLAAQVGEPEIDRPHVLGPDLLENGCAIRHDRIPMRVWRIFARAAIARNGAVRFRAGRPTPGWATDHP